jgi:deazaflavin-dependent oxidoreductase (nitroreductase family)
MRWVNPVVFRLFGRGSRTGRRLVSLKTVGARSGKPRQTTLAVFREGEGAWLVVGSAGGAARHPAWVYNLAEHPESVWLHDGGRTIKVLPRSLSGAERAAAWARITTEAPNFKGYESRTDREIPVIRLTAA